MKKFTKLFLSCALVSAMAVTAASSAFAAHEPVDIKSDDGLTGKATISDDNKVTITNLGGITPAAESEVTFLVFKGTTDTDISDTTIEGIDQNTTDATTPSIQPTNNGLRSAEWKEEASVADATYTIMVGYTNSEGKFDVAKGTFVLTEVKGEKYIIGDVNGDSEIDNRDANKILWYDSEKYEYDECAYTGRDLTISDAGANAATLDKTKLVGDVNNDGDVDNRDANKVLWYDSEKYEYDECANAGAEVTAIYDKATE